MARKTDTDDPPDDTPSRAGQRHPAPTEQDVPADSVSRAAGAESRPDPRPTGTDPAVADRILRASLDLVRELGEPALTIRAIAVRAGVSPTQLYRHFPSKQTIVGAICKHGTRLLDLWLGSAAEGERSRGLDTLCHRYFAFARQRPWLYAIMFRSIRVAPGNPAIETFTGRAQRHFAGDPDAAIRALHLWIAMHGLALSVSERGSTRARRPEGHVPLGADFVASYVRALLRGR